MPLDPVSAGLGLGLGVLATVFVYELGVRKVQNREHAKMTREWSLVEGGGHPVRLAGAALGDLALPPGSKVLVQRGAFVPRTISDTCQVREVSEVPGNFALLQNSALVFAATPATGAPALWSYEEQVMERLHESFDRAWARGEPIVPLAPVDALARFEGQMVAVQGNVREVADKGGIQYLRLMEKGVPATVASEHRVSARNGTLIRAVGRVERAPVGGEAILRATKVEAIG